MTRQQFHVSSNAQMQVGDLRIGVGNIRPAANEGGPFSAALWIYVRGHPELNVVKRLAADEAADVAGYRITMIEVVAGSSPHVRLDIADAGGQPG